ncbi:hypothetical protein [Anaplasma phagocytophilum]|uniref:hypothetical protein n=1 Tax=Anaplasma phagocytophilum TaxID=948 RepID=UPI0007DF967E|nr:hypothetical protein [Anaplasma phagocytophilum]
MRLRLPVENMNHRAGSCLEMELRKYVSNTDKFSPLVNKRILLEERWICAQKVWDL